MARAPSVASVPNSLVVGCGRCAVGSSRGVVCVLFFFFSLSCLELASFSLPCAAGTGAVRVRLLVGGRGIVAVHCAARWPGTRETKKVPSSALGVRRRALNQSRWSEPPTEIDSIAPRPAALAEPPASRDQPATPIGASAHCPLSSVRRRRGPTSAVRAPPPAGRMKDADTRAAVSDTARPVEASPRRRRRRPPKTWRSGLS